MTLFLPENQAKKKAYFQPLSILEIEAVHKNKGTMENFKEIKIATPFQTLHSDIFKSTIVMFISEILHHSIHEEEKNEALFTFLETALHWLDNHDQIANFHLILMLEITKYLGFYPMFPKWNSLFRHQRRCFHSVSRSWFIDRTRNAVVQKTHFFEIR